MARISARQASAASAIDAARAGGTASNKGSFPKGTPKSYSGAANKTMKNGGSLMAAHKAGQAANQAYGG